VANSTASASNVSIKSAADLAKMREAGELLHRVFELVQPMVKPGVTTGQIDDVVYRTITDGGARPSFLNYNGFPRSTCTSVNEQLVHGIPSPACKLKDGDIISIDIGVHKRGWHADRAMTLAVGEVDATSRRLIEAAELSFWAGYLKLAPGQRLGAAQHAIQQVVERMGFHIVKRYVGHGIGRILHEPPQIPNYGQPEDNVRLREGMTLAIEPMVGAGTEHTRELDDKWTVVMADGGRCSHYEHTVAIHKDRVEVLTLPPALAAERVAWATARLREWA